MAHVPPLRTLVAPSYPFLSHTPSKSILVSAKDLCLHRLHHSGPHSQPISKPYDSIMACYTYRVLFNFTFDITIIYKAFHVLLYIILRDACTRLSTFSLAEHQSLPGGQDSFPFCPCIKKHFITPKLCEFSASKQIFSRCNTEETDLWLLPYHIEPSCF